MSESVREWSGGIPGCSGDSGRPPRMSRSVWEALPDVREYPEVVRRPSQMSGSGLKALPDVREWSGVPPRCP